MENIDKGSGVDVCCIGVEVIPHEELADGCREVGNCPDLQGMDLIAHASEPTTNEDGPDVCVQGVETSYRTPTRTIQTVHTVVSSNKISVVSVVEEPKEGMIFKTWQDIEAYYKEYAEQMGFGVSRVQGSFSKKDRVRRGSTWRCECWGRPDMRAARAAKKRAKSMEVAGCSNLVGGVIAENELNRCKRKSKKCECGAKIYASVNEDGDWQLRTVILQHDNHDLIPNGAKLVKEYRMKQMTSTVRKRLINFFDEGVPVSRIHGCTAVEMGGAENMSMTVKDFQHEVYKERRLRMEGGDAAAMMSYFEYMMADSQNFFHANRLDDEGRLKDVLWVDARSRAAYEYFGDVVCFDATYLTNDYDLPFVNFVGVNHHGQSILLGCALVSHEDSDTFRWIFRQWLCCMGNKAPVGILTDQAAAMRKPLEEIMPNTIHRWCIWHIMSKFGDKLGKCPKYSEFKNKLKSVIYESFTVDEFEENWCALIKYYELESNEWLTYMFKERHMWVPAFMKEHFWAGMKTTQRVESINSFFDGFVNRKTKLHEFPRQYNRAMTKRVKDETDADDNCSKYVRRLVSGFKLEKLFQQIYTDKKFQEIQTELSRLLYCYCRDEKMLSKTVVQYLVEDRVWIVPQGYREEIIIDRRRFYRVTFDSVTKEVSCECRKFETFGILCKHMFRIFDQNLVFDIPEKYILTRWRKDVNRRHTRVKVPYHDPSHSAQVKRSYKLLTAFEPLSDLAASVDDETVHLVLTSLKKLQGEVAALKQKKDLLKKAEEVSHFPADGSQVEQQSCGVRSTLASSVRKPDNPCASIDTPLAAQEQEHVTDLSVDVDNLHWSQQLATPTAPKKSAILDPVVQKKRRG